MGGQTNLHARDGTGRALDVQHTTTDSPLLPAENLARLQEIDPALVKWVVDQTEIEANYRRKQDARINWFILIERLSSVLVGGFVAVFGLGAAAYVALQGHDWVAVGIGGSTLAAIVAVLVTKQRSMREENEADERPQKKRK